MIWIGIAVAVVLVLVVAAALLFRSGGGPPSRFPPGTRAFEAELSLGPLLMAIEARRRAKGSASPADAAKLDREIAFLARQVEDLTHVVQARDLSPGKGYIGFQNPPADV